ncbi:UDP-2,3-diacylglucosamine diphosphatase [bacterium]|nr:UDP-2,3-diacylglucosamine diphosphatase [bacterium]
MSNHAKAGNEIPSDNTSNSEPETPDASVGADHPRSDANPVPPEFDCIVISDLHLGSEICQAQMLEDFLEWAVANARMLVINGDIFDDLNFKRLKRHHFNCLRVIRRNTDRADLRVIWIRGNHDGPADIVSHIVGVDVLDEFEFDNGQTRLLIFHGDQFDTIVSGHKGITAFFSAIFRGLKRILPGDWARAIRRFSKSFQRNSDAIRRGAVAEARRRGCPAVTCGHTHAFEDVVVDGVRYINTGTWTTAPPCPYVTIRGQRMELAFWPPVELPVEPLEA